MTTLDTSEARLIGARFAGLGPRLAALLADFILFCALFFPITRLIKGVWLMMPEDHDWTAGAVVFDPICLAFLIFMAVYFIVLEGLACATFGKWVLGLRVVRADTGARPGLGAGALRNLLRFIDGLPALNLLGVLLILDSPERARLGDRVAGTRVVFRAVHTPDASD